MVKVRKAIESMYKHTCTITEHQKFIKENKSTGFKDVVVLENQRCRLSYKTVNNANQTETASSIMQSIKLFIAPEINVKPGSKLTITHNGITTDFKNSGKPAIYDTHQEIILELFNGWT